MTSTEIPNIHNLQVTLRTMKSAKRQRVNMNIWDQDIAAVEEALAFIEAMRSPAVPFQRVPKVRTSHHRNKEEAARLQALVAERYARDEASSVSRPHPSTPEK